MDTEKSSLAYNALYNLIVYKKWSPGEIHSVSEVANKLKISRTPVTEAVNRLEAEGFIRIVPRKGFVVSDANSNEIQEIFEVKAVIEGLAAKKAAERQVENKKELLLGMIAAQEQSMENQDVAALSRHDLDLHFAIFHMSGSATLEKLAISLWHRGHSYIDWITDWDILRGIIKEHKQLVAAIIEGRANDARTIMEQHGNRYLSCLLERKESKQSYEYEQIKNDLALAEKLLTSK